MSENSSMSDMPISKLSRQPPGQFIHATLQQGFKTLGTRFALQPNSGGSTFMVEIAPKTSIGIAVLSTKTIGKLQR